MHQTNAPSSIFYALLKGDSSSEIYALHLIFYSDFQENHTSPNTHWSCLAFGKRLLNYIVVEQDAQMLSPQGR